MSIEGPGPDYYSPPVRRTIAPSGAMRVTTLRTFVNDTRNELQAAPIIELYRDYNKTKKSDIEVILPDYFNIKRKT